jgi:hypothetical protein
MFTINVSGSALVCAITFYTMRSAGFRSTSLSGPQVANSFIQYFIFTVNRQRRIGGVATENCG